MLRRLAVVLIALLPLSVYAAPFLYSVAPDDGGVPRRLMRIDLTGFSTSQVTDLGTADDGYTGGLAFDPAVSQFYAIVNDAAFNSRLVSFPLSNPSAVSDQFILGTGFVGGLTVAGGDVYGIQNDINFNSTLVRIDSVTQTVTPSANPLDLNIAGGLTWDAAQGLIYGIGRDINFNQALYSITSAGVPTKVLDLTQANFTGGLAWDPSSGLLYALAGDPFASELYRIDPNLLSVSKAADLPGGFLFAGAVAVQPVPEPSTAALAVLSLLVFRAWRKT
jgi:hypothetical protein